MTFLSNDLLKTNECGATLRERRHGSGLLLEEPSDSQLPKTCSKYAVEVGRDASPLDMAQDRDSDLLFELRPAFGEHSLHEGIRTADSLGQDDDGVIPRLNEAIVQLRHDTLHVAGVFWNHGKLCAAADGCGDGQIAGVAAHHLDQEAASVGAGGVPDPVDELHDGVGCRINADSHFCSGQVVVDAGGYADDGHSSAG